MGVTSVWWHIAGALLVRYVCVLYGEYHDRHLINNNNNNIISIDGSGGGGGCGGGVSGGDGGAINGGRGGVSGGGGGCDGGGAAAVAPFYTDVDYWVYSDAAHYVCHGQSPYRRATYRYSPLMAWLLAPGCLFLETAAAAAAYSSSSSNNNGFSSATIANSGSNPVTTITPSGSSSSSGGSSSSSSSSGSSSSSAYSSVTAAGPDGKADAPPPVSLYQWSAFGKHMFCVCDVLVGVLLYWLVAATGETSTTSSATASTTASASTDSGDGRTGDNHGSTSDCSGVGGGSGVSIAADTHCPVRAALRCATMTVARVRRSCFADWPTICGALWWYNPLPVAVASRGNGEAPALALVLAALGAASRRHVAGAAVALALATHWRLYPLVLAPAFYWSLAPPPPLQPSLAPPPAAGSLWHRVMVWRHWLRYWLWPHRQRALFVAVFGTCLAALTALCWLTYGWDYIEHALLYHIVRRDVRHNFSVHFYTLYLTEQLQQLQQGWWCLRWLVTLTTFAPQLVLIVAIAARFHRRRNQLPFASFCSVYVLVIFNKVYTAQYWLWPLSLLVAVVPQLSGGGGVAVAEAVVMVAAWCTAQAAWLLSAYQLEFHGQPVFRTVWAASVVLFAVQAAILARLIHKYGALSTTTTAAASRPPTSSAQTASRHEKQS